MSHSSSCFWVTRHVCGETWCGEECLKAGLCQALSLGNTGDSAAPCVLSGGWPASQVGALSLEGVWPCCMSVVWPWKLL